MFKLLKNQQPQAACFKDRCFDFLPRSFVCTAKRMNFPKQVACTFDAMDSVNRGHQHPTQGAALVTVDGGRQVGLPVIGSVS